MSLLKFFFTEKCSNCHQRIEKNASFCRHCGAGRADSWRNCNACGASVAADSRHCWSCNAELTAQPRDQIFSDRWRRTPGVFATRQLIETPQERLRHGIQVDDGTRGALFRDGSIKTELGNGYHAQTSFWERLTGGGKSGGFVEAVVSVSDPVSCFVSLGESSNLHTLDHSAVEAGLMIKVQMDDIAVFTRRMMPVGTDIVRDDDLLLPHYAKVTEILRRHLSGLSVEDVARSVELRSEIEAALGEELPALLKDFGLRMTGVEDIRLQSPDIQRIRDAEGDLARTKREQRWEALKREMEQAAGLDQIKDKLAFEEQVKQWGHEAGLTQLERDHVLAMQTRVREHARNMQDARNKIEIDEVKRRADMKELDDVRAMQEKGISLAMEIKRKKLALEAEFAERKDRHDVEIERHRAETFSDVPAHVAAGVLPGDMGDRVIRTMEALRPLPDVTIIQSGVTTPSFMRTGFAAPVAAGMAGPSLEQLAQRYIGSVGVVVIGQPGLAMMPVGTAWVVAGRDAVATNAHVAHEILAARDDAGMSAWVIFSGSVSPLPVRDIRVHPDYGQGATQGHPVPSYDVAVLGLEGALPGPGLPIAGRQKVYMLRELQPAAYLGFPMENLAGGGTSLERPKAIAKRGSISSLEDWMMRHTDVAARRQLIKHDLGVAGGASGSPMFDEFGDVIGIISAGNMEKLYDEKSKTFRRIPNGVLLNFAQRIDVLSDWMGW